MDRIIPTIIQSVGKDYLNNMGFVDISGTNPPPRNRSFAIANGGVVATIIVLAFVVVALTVLVIFCIYRERKALAREEAAAKARKEEEEESSSDDESSHGSRGSANKAKTTSPKQVEGLPEKLSSETPNPLVSGAEAEYPSAAEMKRRRDELKQQNARETEVAMVESNYEDDNDEYVR